MLYHLWSTPLEWTTGTGAGGCTPEVLDAVDDR